MILLKKIVFFSHTYKRNSIFKVGSHHLADQFSCMGIEVNYYSTPISPVHFLTDRKKFKDVLNLFISNYNKTNNILEFGLFNVFPYAPNMPQLYYKIRDFLDIALFRKKYGRIKTDLLLIDQPNMFHLIEYIDAKKIIYRPTDIYWKFHSDSKLREMEMQVCKKADGIIATSDPVMEHIRNLCGDTMKGKPINIVRNGVEYRKFSTKKAEHKALEKIEKPIAIYVGSLDSRFNFDLLFSVAKQCQNINFVIVGPVDRNTINGFRNVSNVIFLGSISYEKIPGLLQHSNIGIMPFKKNQLNDGRSPMKFYEFMACGIPIVSTGLQEMKNRKCPYVFFADNEEEFASILQEKIKGNYIKTDLMNYAKDQDWSNKAKEILDFYESLY